MNDRRARFAYHESGHLVAAEGLGIRTYGGSISHKGGRTRHKAARTPVERAVVLWGGPVAESIILGGVPRPASWAEHPDYRALRELPGHVSNQGYERAMAIVSEHEPAIHAIAATLVARGRISGRMVRAIMQDPGGHPALPAVDDLAFAG